MIKIWQSKLKIIINKYIKDLGKAQNKKQIY